MEAQELAAKKITCPRCFAEVKDGKTGCYEIDCPLADAGIEIGPDELVYPDLARANLLRMRGEYGEARAICFSLLKQYPGNHTAHTLLGDIYAEQGDLEQAKEWYELALDLQPESETDQVKLAEIQRRIADRDTAKMAKDLGLPTTVSNARKFVYIAIGGIVLLSIGAFLVGAKLNRRSEPMRTITTPVTAPAIQASATPVNVPPVETKSEIPVQPTTPAAPDSTVTDELRREFPQNERVISATLDGDHGLIVRLRRYQGEIASAISGPILDYTLQHYPARTRVAFEFEDIGQPAPSGTSDAPPEPKPETEITK